MQSANQAEHAFPSPSVANYALLVLTTAYVFSFIDRQIISLLVEPIRADLGITDFQISLLQGLAFALFYTVLGVPIARMADRMNRTRIIAVGVFIWCLMTAACGLARSFSILFLARIGVGVGEAALSPAAFSILSDSYPPQRAARAMAIYTLGTTFGAGLAYIIGGLVVDVVTSAEALHLPFIGQIQPWQAAFLAVGLPGLLLVPLVLAIREPQRQGMLETSTGKPNQIPLSTVVSFIHQRWRVYGGIYAGVGLLAVVGYGVLAWFPTLLIRKFGLTPGDIGLSFGLIFICFGTIGALGAAFLAERRFLQGQLDANLSVAMLVAVGMLVPAVVAPLMPNAELTLLCAAPLVLCINAHAGITTAALQLVSPNQMRATVVALMYFVSNLVGLGIGPSLVAGITDFGFGHDGALPYSLAIVGFLCCPVAAVCFQWARPHYGLAVQAVTTSNLPSTPIGEVISEATL
jgi:MFS family permease